MNQKRSQSLVNKAEQIRTFNMVTRSKKLVDRSQTTESDSKKVEVVHTTQNKQLYVVAPSYLSICQKESQEYMKSHKNASQDDVTIGKNGIMSFPFAKRWLNGEEYQFVLKHYRAYLQSYPESCKIADRAHPDIVYEKPHNGQFYFIKGWHLREFGFPRNKEILKTFKWKKMNFTTDLPKNQPLCTYLVATGRVERQCFRMHAVVLSQEYSVDYRKSEILKQLRKESRAKLRLEDAIAKTERIVICHILNISGKKIRSISFPGEINTEDSDLDHDSDYDEPYILTRRQKKQKMISSKSQQKTIQHKPPKAYMKSRSRELSPKENCEPSQQLVTKQQKQNIFHEKNKETSSRIVNKKRNKGKKLWYTKKKRGQMIKHQSVERVLPKRKNDEDNLEMLDALYNQQQIQEGSQNIVNFLHCNEQINENLKNIGIDSLDIEPPQDIQTLEYQEQVQEPIQQQKEPYQRIELITEDIQDPWQNVPYDDRCLFLESHPFWHILQDKSINLESLESLYADKISEEVKTQFSPEDMRGIHINMFSVELFDFLERFDDLIPSRLKVKFLRLQGIDLEMDTVHPIIVNYMNKIKNGNLRYRPAFVDTPAFADSMSFSNEDLANPIDQTKKGVLEHKDFKH